ncbi:MAG: hypothetical protein HC895_24745 [Leptolyngbyaceae cyanobacterium SM1_3_5]|nr:hypothetical protein [Leptolyngbyaceae cyanobacterium SM1_3_5]
MFWAADYNAIAIPQAAQIANSIGILLSPAIKAMLLQRVGLIKCIPLDTPADWRT